MDAFPTLLETVFRPLLAIAGAAVLGWERERHGKAAGLRTQMMVALGAAMFTLITLKLYHAVVAANGGNRIDPVRVVEGVIGGIGFLGAGAIIQARGSVKGMTTAATIWVVGALGVACGLGFYVLAVVTVLFALLILSALGYLEHRVLGDATPGDRQGVGRKPTDHE